jgi:hypothetical protein
VVAEVADIQVVQELVVKGLVVADMAITKAVVVVVLVAGAVTQQPTQTITTDRVLPTMYQAKVTALVATVF